MYNLWIVVIVLAIIEIVLIVLMSKNLLEPVVGGIVGFLLIMFIVALIMFAIIDPIIATNKVNALLVERDALQNLFENREGLDKIYITQRVVEYNKEVARIIGKVEALGNWSAYAFTDYELLTFIEI